MKKYQNYFIVGGIFLFIMITLISYINFDFEEDVYVASEPTTKEVITYFYVDVKGSVKNPGVYEFTNGERVIHAIEKAGGLSKNGNTSNINLSQKLTSEMVVYIYSNTEIKNGAKSINCNTTCDCNSVEINNCYQEEQTNNKININTANLEELLTLSGIGESKAIAIINYRNENGLFITIEDLTNVSGIGLTIFEKIKDKITV